MTFRDLIGRNDITIYTVSRSGSITKHTKMQVYETSKGFSIFHIAIDNLDSNKTGLNKNGCVSSRYGIAAFLDANEAADLAEKIVATKYKNSISVINKIRNDG